MHPSACTCGPRPAAPALRRERPAALSTALPAFLPAFLLAWVLVPMLGTASLPAAAQATQAAQAVPAGAAGQMAVADYTLGAGDVIRISVFQNPDLTLETRIPDNGVISYPLLGHVRVGGRTVGAAEQVIADGLRAGSFVKQPQVTLTVLQVRAHQASVLGQVNRPGRFPLEQTDMRLTDLLALAGGTTPMGAEVVVLSGMRDGQLVRLEVDLVRLFGPGGRETDPLVRNGDVIWVDRQPLVYIYGEVQRPGQMRLERGMTVMQGLAAGGGLTLRGTDKGLRVHRRGSDGRVQVVEPRMDDPLLPGDVIYVRESLF